MNIKTLPVDQQIKVVAHLAHDVLRQFGFHPSIEVDDLVSAGLLRLSEVEFATQQYLKWHLKDCIEKWLHFHNKQKPMEIVTEIEENVFHRPYIGMEDGE